ncbi:MAG TPA: Coagulation factor 5/8 type domain-containing protein [Solirubrobacteraceae bacterium]|nr:Coagulation factor 5/8 type domain-containing protein [Solirubrobacteraceae bacterium]
MPRRHRLVLAACLALVGSAAGEARAQDRYALADGCYALKSVATGKFVVKAADGRYRATAGAAGAAEPFRMQATALGRYLFYGAERDFMGAGNPSPLPAPGLPLPVPGLPVATTAADGDPVRSAAAPSPSADWRVDPAGEGFTIGLGGEVVSVDSGGPLVMRSAGSERTRFAFAARGGCQAFPEIALGVSGDPSRGSSSWGEVRGLIDGHMHMMAFEFLGGRIHCGRPWHPYGVAAAMVDCPDHEPGGTGAAAENVLSYGDPTHRHDTVGWPTFKDWPSHASLTHEQSYYRWLERSWRAGQRIFVNLLVDNAVLCDLYPLKKNSCNEMDGVRLQARRIHELQDYIDAQNGGPGKGWFRIVDSPYEARRVINDGKLAVILGIEVSKLFDCGLDNERAECTAEQIDRRLDEVHAMGVRDMELVNKFDNALAGVAGDSAETGLVVNNGNRIETGKYWQMQSCDGHDHVHDRSQATAPGVERDSLAGNVLRVFGPTGLTPVYGPAPHCNTRGLSKLGAHLVRRMIAKRMIVDPDHLSVRARRQVLEIVEEARYSGIISSHSWSTPDSIPRIYRLGGFATPYAGAATEFVTQWREALPVRDRRFYQGVGWGADMNGFGAQGPPRNGPNPVTYPFKSWDGKVTIDKQHSGQRVYDINVDGVAHYGLYPDWVEDLRHLAGQEIIDDLGRGAEAYLQMWERADGIPTGCRPGRARLTTRGLAGARLGAGHASLLRRAGQPRRRGARTWRYCVDRGKLAVALTPAGRVALVGSTAPGHKARGIRTGMKAKRVRSRSQPFGRGLRKRGRFVYVVRGGRVRAVAVTTAKTRRSVRRYLRLAGLR